MLTAIILIFVLVYAAIALEHPLRVNKSASALLGAGLLCISDACQRTGLGRCGHIFLAFRSLDHLETFRLDKARAAKKRISTTIIKTRRPAQARVIASGDPALNAFQM